MEVAAQTTVVSVKVMVVAGMVWVPGWRVVTSGVGTTAEVGGGRTRFVYISISFTTSRFELHIRTPWPVTVV